MPKSQMALKMASWCLRTTWEQPLRWRWTKSWRCSTHGKVGASTSPEHLTSWWKFTAGIPPASSGLGASKTARRFVHRRVSVFSALRSLISCKRIGRRWIERSPCSRNGKREWKGNLKFYTWLLVMAASPCFSSAQQCSWSSWCYWRVWTPKTLTPQRCCAWAWCCRWLFCPVAASLLRLLVSDVQVHVRKCWHIMHPSAVASWAALLWR